jgi:RNA polymerase sigma-70 factor (ECF subfamily)
MTSQATGLPEPPPLARTEAAEWVEAHGDYLFSYAMARLRDRDAAEDVVQETFIGAMKGAKSFAGNAALRTWLTGILKHKIADHFRRSSRSRSFDAGEDVEEPYFGADEHWTKFPGKWQADPREAVNSGDLRKVLNHCLDALPRGLAQVFVLRELEELSAEEVCATLGISTANLYTALHRARFRLRRCVEVKWFEKGAS